MTQEAFDAAVSAELVRLTLGGKPDRPELKARCELSDLLVEHCAHCLSGAPNLGHDRPAWADEEES